MSEKTPVPVEAGSDDFTPEQVATAYRLANLIVTGTGARAITAALRALLMGLCPVVRAVTGRALPVCSS